MADVYRALDTRLDREVAVKVFRSSTDDAGRVRFEAEAKLLAKLDHPGLVTVHDAGFDEGEPFLVMRLVEGKALASRLADGPLPATEVPALGRELAEVLAYVHANDIVHRDVKPSNVLLADDGRAFLADFGISRLINATARVTEAGKIMGTVGYLAPEQVLGVDATQAVDVYSLGLVLLECVTGRPEYDGSGVEGAIARLHRPPQIPGELAEPLASVLRLMTASKPEERPSIAECAAILAGRRAIDSAPVTSRRRWAVLGAAAGGIAVVAAGSALLLSGHEQQDSVSPQPPSVPAVTSTVSSPPGVPGQADRPAPDSPGRSVARVGGNADLGRSTTQPPGADPQAAGQDATPSITSTTIIISDSPATEPRKGNGKARTKTRTADR